MDEQGGRRDEVAARLAAVRERIEVAATRAHRPAGDITLVVVTKFFPESDVRILADLGVREVGENRHQEAEPKAAACADLDLSWHFIGGLQSNKAAAVAAYADVVESVDHPKLVGRLSRGAVERGRDLGVLVQVRLDPPTASGRSGCDPDEVPPLVEQLLEAPGLRLRGVMAVAPLGEDPAPAFERLAVVAGRVRSLAPGATWISAGMSGDLEEAIACGATHVRVGSAVLGRRPSIQ
ncbi:MAG TPA: YggS family pyridoxal phosphate-dependent enzyme [Marmoricola sp.]